MNEIDHSTILGMPLLLQKEYADPAIEAVLKRINLRAKLRVAWLRELWRRSGKEQDLDFHDVIDNLLLRLDTPQREQIWREENKELRQLVEELNQVEQFLREDKNSRLTRLGFLFGFTKEASDLFQAALAISLDPALERVYSYLQDHADRGFVTEFLVARLFSYSRSHLPMSTFLLEFWGLIHKREGISGHPARYQCDPFVKNWLLNNDELDPGLLEIACFQEVKPRLKNWPVEQALQYVNRSLSQNPLQRLRLCIRGLAGSGRKSMAAYISRELGMSLLVVDCDRIDEASWKSLYMRAQRQAYMGNYALAWIGSNVQDIDWLKDVSPVQLQFLISETFNPPKAIEGVIDFELQVEPLDSEGRRQLWQKILPVSQTWPAESFLQIVNRYKVNVGQITAVASKSIDSPEEAMNQLRFSTRHRLGRLAEKLECPFNWDDLVINSVQKRNLEDFVFEAKERETFWQRPEARRLFPQGKGLMALFTGPSGTGKTMAAQVIAMSLGLDLFRINLASVVSKYIGETSKHIDKILTRARHMHAILLFDEADTLFGKRTEIKDAHDRYANADTNYLLQAIENYPGIALLTSNKKGNIDTAFIRRLRFVFEFQKPDAAQRLKIWEQVTEELSGKERLLSLSPQIRQLAHLVEMTGAQIKYALLSGIFIAQKEDEPLSIIHLIRGLERELMKEGRGISPDARKRLELLS